MAKRQKPSVGRPPKGVDSNGINIETMDGFVERIEGLHAEGRVMHADYMKERKSLNQDISAVYARARDNGIPNQILRVTVAQRDLDRRALALPDKLEIEDRYLFDDMMARWESIKAGTGDPGAGVLVKRPAVLDPIGRPEPAEAEKESA